MNSKQEFILYLLSFALSHPLLQPPWVPGKTGLLDNIFMTSDQNYPYPKEQWSLTEQTTPPQMRTMTYNDKVETWRRSNKNQIVPLKQ
jgi:hypothetical protein